MTLRGIQEYIARDVNNIVSIEGNTFLYPPKKSHPISLLLFIQGFVCHLLSNDHGWLPAAILTSHESESLWDVATVTKVGGA